MESATEKKSKIKIIINKAYKLLTYICIIICALFSLIPFIMMISTALKPENEVFSKVNSLVGSRIAWENFENAWNFVPFGNFFTNTIIVSFTVTILVLLTSALSAYAFARLNFPGRDLLFLLYLSTLMIPSQVTIIPQFILMNKFDWVDKYPALILPCAFTAFGTFLLRQFFMSIPKELEDAAKIDGCNYFTIFFKIILPLSKSALASLAVFTFTAQWNSFLWPLIVTSSDHMKTLSVGLSMFQGIYGTEWHLLMAASTIVTIPTVIIFAFLQRYLVEGISLTGMGGM